MAGSSVAESGAGRERAVRITTTAVRVRRILRVVLVYAGMLLVSFILIVPLLWLFSASLKTQQLVLQTPRGFGEFLVSLVPTEPHWENYVEALTRRPFGLWTRNTVIIVERDGESVMNEDAHFLLFLSVFAKFLLNNLHKSMNDSLHKALTLFMRALC